MDFPLFERHQYRPKKGKLWKLEEQKDETLAFPGFRTGCVVLCGLDLRGITYLLTTKGWTQDPNVVRRNNLFEYPQAGWACSDLCILCLTLCWLYVRARQRHGLFCIRGHGTAIRCPMISCDSAGFLVTRHSQVFTAASVLHCTAVVYQDPETSHLDLAHAIMALMVTSAEVSPLWAFKVFLLWAV